MMDGERVLWTREFVTKVNAKSDTNDKNVPASSACIFVYIYIHFLSPKYLKILKFTMRVLVCRYRCQASTGSIICVCVHVCAYSTNACCMYAKDRYWDSIFCIENTDKHTTQHNRITAFHRLIIILAHFNILCRTHTRAHKQFTI